MSEENTLFIRICQEGHANGLALNKDCTHIAVAGRSLLKVFSIDPDGFTEVCNMRGGKNQNLSYSSNDVAWSTLDNNILATAATNGVVSVWDLSRFGRQKQLMTYNEHERTAHTVTFHSTEPYLLSGSQDGTIKRFDLKNEKYVTTYCSNSESVRDVKFNPNSPNTFAAVSENGTVQLWDIRRSDKCLLQFTAHSGPIYTCDWHSSQPWLATGSRDKQIKVWNMGAKPSLEYTIHTIAVVGRVKWRPEFTYHIASCSLVVDYSIHIWDVRRPYIPFASFNEHSNVTTGITWKGTDPYVLLSTSKDSTIYKHVFKDATRPSAKANPQGASLNYKGDLLFSYKVKVAPAQATNNNNSRIPFSKLKHQQSNDQFHLAKSQLQNFFPAIPVNLQTSPSKDLDRTNLYKDYLFLKSCAKNYILSNKPLPEICDHNAEIALKYGKYDVRLLWKFIKKLYSTSKRSNSNSEQHKFKQNINSNQNLLVNRLISQNQEDKIGSADDELLLSGNIVDEAKQLDFKHPKSGEFKHAGGSCRNTFPSSQAITEPYGDCIFGDTELTINNMDCVKSLRNGFLYTGPHDLCKGWSLPSSTIIGHDLQPSRPHELTPDHTQELVQASDPPTILKIIAQPGIPQWEPHRVLADCLTLQTEVGDVQTSVSILIALGERRCDLPIDDYTSESWLLSYIDLLHRHQLWSEAAEITKLSWIRSVNDINEQSTAVHTNCGGCGRPLQGSAGWYCYKCKSAESSKCSVCHLVVRGLYAWCQGCSHGGHLEHMKQWFQNHSKCPKCGHLCEYE